MLEHSENRHKIIVIMMITPNIVSRISKTTVRVSASSNWSWKYTAFA